MSNILPPERLKSALGEYRTRLMLTFSLVALSVALLSAATLLPSYLVIEVVGTPAGSSAQLPPASSDGAELSHAQELLANLSPLVQSSTTPTDLVSEALAFKPSAVTVDHINFTAGTPDTLILSGNGDPASIDAYRHALSGDARFTNVSVPIEDLAGSTGGEFSITVTGNF